MRIQPKDATVHRRQPTVGVSHLQNIVEVIAAPLVVLRQVPAYQQGDVRNSGCTSIESHRSCTLCGAERCRLSKIHFLHTLEEINCLCAVESCSHGAGGPENLGDCIRALLGQCWGLLVVGLESAQKVQRVFEALKLLFIEQVSTSLCLEEQIPFFNAKVVAFLSRRGSSIGPSDEKNC